jgi:two-component system, OmpR family, sensor histidine kinase MprB
MSFQRRVMLTSAVAVAVAIAIASLATYVLVRNDLSRHINRSLNNLASAFVSAEHSVGPGRRAGRRIQLFGNAGAPLPPLRYARALLQFPNHAGDVTQIFGLLTSHGTSYSVFEGQRLSMSAGQRAAVLRLARSGDGTYAFIADVRGSQYRVLAAGVDRGVAVLVTHGMTETDSTLAELRLILLVLTLGGAALASLLGWFVARTALAPVRRLTAAVQRVTQTKDLGERIDERRRDEIGSLARSFNSMLGVLGDTVRRLDESAKVQRRLVADASHELRTPVTSLRTNIEVLERADELPPAERSRLIADVVEQLEELSLLINDLIELARDDEHVDTHEDVRFDILVSEAIERARLHAPSARFEAELEPTLVSGVPARLDRAVNNLLDNAVKFAGTEEPIEVRLHDGVLEVRDHGPGIAPDDLPHVFDRFFRGARSRALPGSGLGLAIVRQVAELHAGTVSAATAPDGGTVMRMRVPVEAWG